ncbi:MAG: protein kinase [Desulfuromonadales bacterium]|nr:protein kinase [Desulfuromonadales bacterium]
MTAKYGRYEIIREVGRGSMGVVYQARDPHIDRVLAVKVLRQDRMTSDTILKRFMKEAIIIGRLSHPNIVTIYDVGEENGNVYIAMEFLEGKALSDIIKQKTLSAAELVEFGVQIAETLDYAHNKGIIHRDIKPSNIIVQPGGSIKITDFGIARIDDVSATLQTQAGEIMGTPAYMSPEQVLGKPVDGRSDIFSLGVILYEMGTGGRPFGGEAKTLATIFNDIIQTIPTEPSAATTLIPPGLSGVIMKALQKEPAQRFQTGKEFAAALKKCLGGEEPVGMPVRPVKAGKRPTGPLFAVVALLVLLGTAIGFWVTQGKDKALQAPPAIHEKVLPTPMAPTPVAPAAKIIAPAPEIKKIPAEAVQPVAKTVEAKKTEVKPLAREQKTPDHTPRMDRPHVKPVRGTTVPVTTEPRPAGTKLAALKTSLKVRTSPQGASVYIDGDSKGTTPLTLLLSVGKHHLRIVHSGYQDLERDITVDEMMEYPLSFNLKATD